MTLGKIVVLAIILIVGVMMFVIWGTTPKPYY